MKGVYVFLADGFEEIEALATVDILRRGGVPVKTVSLTRQTQVRGAHDIRVEADMNWRAFEKGVDESGADASDAMVFPGGLPGAQNLADQADLIALARRHATAGGTIAAICAAPGLVVSQLPGIYGRKVTCYDGFETALQGQGAVYVKEPAVRDGNLVTGRGPAFAVDFALLLLEQLKGPEAAAAVRKGMLL